MAAGIAAVGGHRAAGDGAALVMVLPIVLSRARPTRFANCSFADRLGSLGDPQGKTDDLD